MAERPPFKLREDLIIKRRVDAGEVKYMVKDPLRMEYFTLQPLAYDLLSLCDGERDFDTLLGLARARFPQMKIEAETLLNFFEAFKQLHYLEDAWNRNILLIEKGRKAREKVWKAVNPGEIHLGGWDPDRFLARIVKPLAFLFTRPAMLAYALITITAFSLSFAHADEFALSFAELWVIPGRPWLGLVVLWACLLGTVFLHEIGHGLTCKHYGGEVHKIGVMLLYFSPCFFCDVTESLFFERKNQRQAVTAAGGIVNLVTASLATFVWFFTARDLFVNQVAHRVALYSGLSTVIFNLNPLSRYDGYFLLSHHLEMPNLQKDSYRFLGQKIRRVLRLPYESKPVSRRERRIYWIYGTMSAVYLACAMTLIWLWVSGWLVESFRVWGYVAAGLLLWVMSGRYRKSFFGFVRFAALDKGTHFRRHKIPYLAAGAALALGLLLFPLPRSVDGRFLLRPGREVVLRAAEEGVIEAVFAAEGDRVAAGAVLMELRQEGIALQRNQGAARRAGAETRGVAALVARDPMTAAAQAAEAQAGAALEQHGAQRARRLRPTAPFDGIVLTARIEERVGCFVAVGDTLCEIGALDTLRAEVMVDELMLGIVDPGAPVALRADSPPWRIVRGRVLRLSLEPGAGQERRLYRVVVETAGIVNELRPGMSGQARFGARPASALEQIGGWLLRILRVEFWL